MVTMMFRGHVILTIEMKENGSQRTRMRERKKWNKFILEREKKRTHLVQQIIICKKFVK